VLELVPDNAAANTNLGTVLTNESRFGEARKGPGKSRGAKPTYSAYNNLGEVDYLEGHYAGAAAIMKSATAE